MLPATLGLTSFDKRAEFVHGNISAAYSADPKFPGILTASTKLKYETGVTAPPKATYEQIREAIMLDLRDGVKSLDAIRTGTATQRSVDLSFGDYVQGRWGFANNRLGSPEGFYTAIGVNPEAATIQSLMAMPDFNENFRWLIPEVIREAIRLGLRKNPLYPNIIAAEETVAQAQVTMPFINMSDAMPTQIGEAETIPMGTVSFGQKVVHLTKVGVGMKITDEVQQYVAINILSMYMQDIGVKLNLALDVMAINTLINGESGNNNAAPLIGTNTVNDPATPGTGLTYRDLLRGWIRMGMLGRLPQSLLSNEDMALEVLTLPEFTNRLLLLAGLETKNLNLRTPIPSTSNYDVHGAFPSSDQVMLIDNTSSLIKLNAQAIRVESDRIAEKGMNGTYVTLTTGFAKMFVDAAIIFDQTLLYGSQGFPSYMDVAKIQKEAFRVR